jgi:DNA polymerase-1
MKLLAIDGNSILNRAFYGIKLLSNKKGVFTNAVFGFMNIYLKNIAETSPDCIAVAFDLRSPTFRHKAVSSYKANRKGMPTELAQQLPIVKELLSLMGIKVVECEGYEADDILGTLSKSCSDNGNECVILTGDRDSLQLIDEKVSVHLASNKETIIYDREKFIEEYGFEPLKLIDYKALMGDSSDNISGVAGIGKKTAADLIKQFGTVEEIYSSLSDSNLKSSICTKLINGESAAKESKWLATIVRDVPIDTDIMSYKPSEPDNSGITKLLSELEMFKLLDKLNLSAVEIAEEKTEEVAEIVLEEMPLTSEIIDSLESCVYTFDGQTLNILDDKKLYSSDDKQLICRFLESESAKITIDSKPHYRYAFSNGIKLNNLKLDIAICGYLLNPSASEYTIQKLCAEYGTHYHSDIVSMGQLSEILESEIEKEGMKPLLENIEMPLIEVLASMEHTGIYVDRENLSSFGTYLSEMIEETEQMIYDEAGHKFNISSPKQLSAVLFDEMGLPARKKTKSGYSTNAEVLEELRLQSPFVDNVLKYRQYTKLKSTYVTGLTDKIENDGRVHTCYKQTETRTGRISSTEPNLQNIPVRTELGSEMRKFFKAGEGKILLDADYSQIELRVMAHLCGDENMIAAFNSDTDIHTATAAQVFDMPLNMVTNEMRSAAKSVNFGIIYGIGAFSLSKDINTSVAKAKKYIEDYLAKYPKVHEFMENTIENARQTGYVSTLFGRRRRVPELVSSNKILQSAGKRIAMNTPVQGTAADLIKIAMVNVYRRLKEENLDAELILQVHDELIVESTLKDSERAAEILGEEMRNVYKLSVPLAAEVNTGETWYDAKG